MDVGLYIFINVWCLFVCKTQVWANGVVVWVELLLGSVGAWRRCLLIVRGAFLRYLLVSCESPLDTLCLCNVDSSLVSSRLGIPEISSCCNIAVAYRMAVNFCCLVVAVPCHVPNLVSLMMSWRLLAGSSLEPCPMDITPRSRSGD